MEIKNNMQRSLSFGPRLISRAESIIKGEDDEGGDVAILLEIAMGSGCLNMFQAMELIDFTSQQS